MRYTVFRLAAKLKQCKEALEAVLDDLKFIHERDPQDSLGLSEKQPAQLRHSFGFDWTPPEVVHEVIVAGMGGSGIAAKAYKAVPDLSVPFEIVQDYDLPGRASKNTLLVCLSYSGNTEETVSVINQALEEDRPYPRPMVVVIASGGQLIDLAKEHGLPNIVLPGGLQPRYAFGYQYKALAEVLEATPLADSFLPTLDAAAAKLEKSIAGWLPTVATKDNLAKRIALECIGKSVVIYAGPKLAPAAYKWKVAFNENAKQVAWCGQYPEFNHNEFTGWTRQPEQKPYAIIGLHSQLDNQRVQKRFDLSERLLSGLWPAPLAVEVQGKTPLEQLLWAISLGDFVSIYTAILSNTNTAKLEQVDKFKKAMEA